MMEPHLIFQMIPRKGKLWKVSMIVCIGLKINLLILRSNGHESYSRSLSSPESEHKVESGLFLDVVVTEWSSVLKLLSSEDQSLLIWGNTFLVLDLSLDSLNWVRWLDIEGDGLASQGLDEDLHSTSKSEDQVESWLLLDVVVGERPSVFKLLSSEDKSLLIGRDSLLVLDLSFDSFDWVWWLNIEGNGLACEGLDKNLHECLFLIMNSVLFRYNLNGSFWSILTYFLLSSECNRYAHMLSK